MKKFESAIPVVNNAGVTLDQYFTASSRKTLPADVSMVEQASVHEATSAPPVRPADEQPGNERVATTDRGLGIQWRAHYNAVNTATSFKTPFLRGAGSDGHLAVRPARDND